MTAARLKILCVLLALLLAGALILLFHYRSALQRSEARPAFVPGDAVHIERAYRLEAARERRPVERVREDVYPVVVGFPDRTCVQLMPPPPSIGGHSLYCFRNADGGLVEQHQIGG